MYAFRLINIEDSSWLWEVDTGTMTGLIARHYAILREVVGAHGGRITKPTFFWSP